jgi:hypothetical protein
MYDRDIQAQILFSAGQEQHQLVEGKACQGLLLLPSHQKLSK